MDQCARTHQSCEELRARQQSFEHDPFVDTQGARKTLDTPSLRTLTEDMKFGVPIVHRCKYSNGERRCFPRQEPSDEKDLLASALHRSGAFHLRGERVWHHSNLRCRAQLRRGFSILGKNETRMVLGTPYRRQPSEERTREAARCILQIPSSSKLRKKAEGRIDASSDGSPYKWLIQFGNSCTGPVARQSRMMNDVEVNSRIQVACDPGSLLLPRVVVPLETQHSQMLEPIAGDSELQWVKMDPITHVRVRECSMKSGNGRRIGDSPHLMFRRRRHHGSVANLVLGASAWLAGPGGDEDLHGAS